MVHLSDRPLADGGDTQGLAQELARQSDGASGAQIAGIVRRAAMSAVRRAVRAGESGHAVGPEITREDLRDALAEALGRRSGEEAA